MKHTSIFFSKAKEEKESQKNPKKLRRTIYQKPTREISKRDFSAESKEFLRGEEEEEDKKMEGKKKYRIPSNSLKKTEVAENY